MGDSNEGKVMFCKVTDLFSSRHLGEDTSGAAPLAAAVRGTVECGASKVCSSSPC